MYVFEVLLKGSNDIVNLIFFTFFIFFSPRGMENLVAGSNLPPLFTDEDGSKEGSEINVTG